MAPGLLAHHSFKAAAPARKMHLLPQGSNINPNSTTVTTVRKNKQSESAELKQNTMLHYNTVCCFQREICQIVVLHDNSKL